MKARELVIILLVLFVVGSTAMLGQAGAAKKTPVAGTETFDPFGMLGAPVGQILDPGTVRCPGHDPTGDPLQPCPVGSRSRIRGFTYVSRVDSMDASLSGNMTVELNANFDADSTGPVWGTFSLALDAGGTLDGTFQGRRMQEDDHFIVPLQVSGQGTGGGVDGVHLMAVDLITAFSPGPFPYTGIIEGRIVDPRSK